MAALSIFVLTVSVLAGAEARANSVELEPAQAILHVHEQARVCGVVTSARYAVDRLGQPTFLSLGLSYPHPMFTVVIWGNSRQQFTYQPESLDGRKICIDGTIFAHYGRAYMQVRSEQQVDVQPLQVDLQR